MLGSLGLQGIYLERADYLGIDFFFDDQVHVDSVGGSLAARIILLLDSMVFIEWAVLELSDPKLATV